MSSKERIDPNQDEEALTEAEEELFEEGEDDDDATNVSPVRVPSPEVITLPSGEALTAQETEEITSKTRARVIMVAGAPLSGKTTLMYCLFLCFQRGPFANYSFTESRTLMGLERAVGALGHPQWDRQRIRLGRKWRSRPIYIYGCARKENLLQLTSSFVTFLVKYSTGPSIQLRAVAK